MRAVGKKSSTGVLLQCCGKDRGIRPEETEPCMSFLIIKVTVLSGRPTIVKHGRVL